MRRCSRWRSSARRSRPSARSRSPSPSATRTGSTARARSTGRIGSSGRSIPPAHIYYKYEGGSPAGSHKPNTALAAGVLQQGAGRHPAGDRDRCRPVGERPGLRRRLLRPRGQGLHGPRQLRPEAVPPRPHGDLRRGGRGQPVADHELRAVGAGRDARQPGLARAWRSARRSRTPRRATTPSTPSARCSTTCSSTRPSSARRRIEQMGMAGESPDVDHRLHRRRLELRGPHVPVPRAQPARGREAPDHRGRARGGAEPDPRHLRLRLRRHGQDGARRQDAHARPRLHPGADPRRRPALPRHVAAGQPAQGARPHRGAERPPAVELRGRRAVRPRRGHPAGTGADARHPRRDRRGA